MLHMYIYIDMHSCDSCVCIYVYIYIEREREPQPFTASPNMQMLYLGSPLRRNLRCSHIHSHLGTRRRSQSGRVTPVMPSAPTAPTTVGVKKLPILWLHVSKSYNMGISKNRGALVQTPNCRAQDPTVS